MILEFRIMNQDFSKNMGKIDDEVAILRKEVGEIRGEIQQISFNILRLLSQLGNISVSGGGDAAAGSASPAQITSAIDLGPIEERLDELTKRLL